jgi:glucose-1-phosphate cytidylyltransferase
MKVVLFCGGLGTRLRDYSDAVPKPMVTIGARPIMWHLMRYYAHYGHTEFILCLGYKSEAIKEYFLDYREWLSNDFILTAGGRELELLARDIDDWKITFVDTGINASIGERLKAVERHLDGEDVFLANYSDGLSDLPLDDYVATFLDQDKVASFVAVQSTQSFHMVDIENGGDVTGIAPVGQSDIWVNGGFFVLRKEIFEYLRPGEDLVFEPFQRLIEQRKLWAYRYPGFWMAMDTFKDKQALDERYDTGDAPWVVWKPASAPAT